MNQFLFKINNRYSICGFLKFICDIFFIIHFSLIRLDFTSIDEKLSRDIDIIGKGNSLMATNGVEFFFFFLKIHQMTRLIILLLLYYYLLFLGIYH